MDDLDRLTARFAELGAPDPRSWAQSQLQEGIPQLARYLFLREAWRLVVAEGDRTWIEQDVASAERDPQAPYAGAGSALKRLRALGAADADITDLVRGKQAELLFSLCSLLDDPTVDDVVDQDIFWALVQVTDAGDVLATISALHESVLETDPTGREMRPRQRDA